MRLSEKQSSERNHWYLFVFVSQRYLRILCQGTASPLNFENSEARKYGIDFYKQQQLFFATEQIWFEFHKLKLPTLLYGQLNHHHDNRTSKLWPHRVPSKTLLPKEGLRQQFFEHLPKPSRTGGQPQHQSHLVRTAFPIVPRNTHTQLYQRHSSKLPQRTLHTVRSTVRATSKISFGCPINVQSSGHQSSENSQKEKNSPASQ